METPFVPDSWRSVWEDAKSNIPPDCIVSATVGDPETVKSTFSKHVVYNVVTQYHVKRRYADFEWLREKLAEKYTGMFIPMKPAKYPDPKTKALGNDKNVTSNFILNRSSQLNIFLNSILANPFCSQDSLVEKFLSETDPNEWKSFRESAQTSLFEETSGGAVRWRKIVRSLPDNFDCESVVRTTIEHLNVLLPVLNDTKNMNLVASAYTQSTKDRMSALHHKTLEWAGKEIGVESARGAESDVEQSKNSVESLVMTTNNMEINTLAINRTLTSIVFPNFMHQICMIEGMLDLFKRLDMKTKEIEALQKKILSKKNKKDQLADHVGKRRTSIYGFMATSVGTKEEDVEQDIRAKEDHLAELRRSKSYMERAITFSEVNRFFAERNMRMTNLSSLFLAANEAIVSKMHTTCTDIASKFNVTTAQHKGRLGHIFEAVSLDVIEEQDEGDRETDN